MVRLLQLIMFATVAVSINAQNLPQGIASHAKAANEAERRNDFPAAVREYELLVRALPNSAEMRSNLGVALYFNHERAKSLAAFHKAIELKVDLVAPHLFSGLAWYQLSDCDHAIPELREAVRLSPSDVNARVWLGYAFNCESRYDEAISEFEAATNLDATNIDAWYALGQSYLEKGRAATVRLLAVAPDGGRAWQLAGEQFQMQGNQSKALEEFKGAFSRRPDIAELRSLLNMTDTAKLEQTSTTQSPNQVEDDAYRQAHEAEQKSNDAFQRVLQVAPNSYRAHQIIADAFDAQSQSEKAVQEYRTVLELKSDLPGIHEAIAKSLARSGDSKGAVQELRSELTIQPLSSTIHVELARLLLMIGEDEQAQALLTKALQLNRPPADAYLLLGKLDLRRSRYDAAVSDLTQYVSTSPNNSDAYYLLSRAYRALGNKEQMNHALDLYNQTSKDRKARSLAQKSLEDVNETPSLAEEASSEAK